MGQALGDEQGDVAWAGADVEHVTGGAEFDEALDEGGVGAGVIHLVIVEGFFPRVHDLGFEDSLQHVWISCDAG